MKSKWVHRIWQAFVWLFLAGIFVVTLGFTEKQRTEVRCNQILVRILDSNDNHFLKATDILNYLSEHNFKVKDEFISTLPLNELETELSKVPHIYNVQVYTTIDGKLFIDVVQRTPMLRVLNYNYESYYVDDEGVLFPISDNYTARVLVASGNLNEPYALYCGKKASEAEKQEQIKRETLLDDLYYLSHYIYNDSLWSAMFEQIYVNENKEFELVPKVGDIIIELGDTSELHDKFIKLRAFYEQIVPKINLEDFSRVNLKYKKQIVCTKKILSYESKQ